MAWRQVYLSCFSPWAFFPVLELRRNHNCQIRERERRRAHHFSGEGRDPARSPARPRAAADDSAHAATRRLPHPAPDAAAHAGPDAAARPVPHAAPHAAPDAGAPAAPDDARTDLVATERSPDAASHDISDAGAHRRKHSASDRRAEPKTGVDDGVACPNRRVHRLSFAETKSPPHQKADLLSFAEAEPSPHGKAHQPSIYTAQSPSHKETQSSICPAQSPSHTNAVIIHSDTSI